MRGCPAGRPEESREPRGASDQGSTATSCARRWSPSRGTDFEDAPGGGHRSAARWPAASRSSATQGVAPAGKHGQSSGSLPRQTAVPGRFALRMCSDALLYASAAAASRSSEARWASKAPRRSTEAADDHCRSVRRSSRHASRQSTYRARNASVAASISDRTTGNVSLVWVGGISVRTLAIRPNRSRP